MVLPFDSKLCVMQLNSLKSYLKLQSLPSLQDAYALPSSPHHVATLASSMHKMQLATPTGLAASLLSTYVQHNAADKTRSQCGHYAASAIPVQRRRAHTSLGFSSADGAACREDQEHAATEGGGLAGGTKGVQDGHGIRSPKRGWDDSGIQRMQSSLRSCIGSSEEERYWEQQHRLLLAEQHQESCKAHLAW